MVAGTRVLRTTPATVRRGPCPATATDQLMVAGTRVLRTTPATATVAGRDRSLRSSCYGRRLRHSRRCGRP